MGHSGLLILLGGLMLSQAGATAQEKPAGAYDDVLAKKLGADEMGMKSYVLVVLKTGPTKVEDAGKRAEMFKGHMANIQRLAAEGKLVFAGPLDGVDGWRGLFIFATTDMAAAKAWVATDPVIVQGEMVAEYHRFYGSAGLMMVNEIHGRIEKKAH